METLGAVAGSLGFFAIIIGGLMFLPLGFLKRRRKVARNILIGGIAGFVFGLIAAPSHKQDEAAKDPKANTRQNQASAPAKAQASKVPEGEIRELWNSLTTITGECDEAAKQTAKALDGGDIYVIYPAAKDASRACSESSASVSSLKPPASSSGEVRAAFERAIKQCSDGDIVRAGAFAKVAAIADGNSKPSAVMDAKEDLETGSQAGLYCATGMLVALAKAGYDASFFKDDKKNR